MNTKTKSNLILTIIKYVLILLFNIIFYILIIFAIWKMCSIAYDFSYQVFGEVIVQEPPGQNIQVQINDGESTKQISDKLQLMGLIVDKNSFFIRAKLSVNTKNPIKPGKYTLNTSMTYDEILKIITHTSEQKDDAQE